MPLMPPKVCFFPTDHPELSSINNSHKPSTCFSDSVPAWLLQISTSILNPFNPSLMYHRHRLLWSNLSSSPVVPALRSLTGPTNLQRVESAVCCYVLPAVLISDPNRFCKVLHFKVPWEYFIVICHYINKMHWTEQSVWCTVHMMNVYSKYTAYTF